MSFVQNIGLRRNADGQVLSLFKSSKRATILQSILEKVISVLLSRKFQKKRMDKSVLMYFANQCQPALQKKTKLSENNIDTKESQNLNLYSRVLKKLSQCCFLESFKKKRMDKSVLMYFANQPASQKEKPFGGQQQGQPEFYHVANSCFYLPCTCSGEICV